MHNGSRRVLPLDPAVTNDRAVTGYFDDLMRAGASHEALLRGAAALTGAIAGGERRGKVSRWAPDGPARAESGSRVVERNHRHGTVWLERVDEAQANDALVIERLALAAELAESRRTPPSELEVVIDEGASVAERRRALVRLHLTPASRIRIVATGMDTAVLTGASTAAVPTSRGLIRATLVRTDEELPCAPLGLGLWVRADEAPTSWQTALTSLRLTEPANPVIDAEDLGAFLLLARLHGSQAHHPDVQRLAALDERSALVLRTLIDADSLRAAATMLGMHHSSLQARHESLTNELGYDPRTPIGRVRYSAAEFLRRVGDD